jgi:hypothetical protein
MDETIQKIAIRLAQGENPRALRNELEQSGLSKDEAAHLVTNIGAQLEVLRGQNHRRALWKRNVKIASMQVGLIGLTAIGVSLIFDINGVRGCIANAGILGLCVIDTVLLTAFGSGALTAFGFALTLFTAYGDQGHR